MIRVYLIVFLIGAFFWFKVFVQKAPAERKHYIKKSVLYGIVLSFLLLAIMGRLNWIIAAVSVLAAFVMRFLPIVLRYAPQLQRLWVAFRDRGNPAAAERPGGRAQSAVMSVEEAYKILGVSLSATRQEIIAAHRKLMLKNHPDRGGSSYLAAQINRAKELLLKHK